MMHEQYGPFSLLNGSERLFEYMPRCLFFMKDREGRFLTVNAEMARVFGAVDASEVVGRTDADFLPGYIADSYRNDDLQLFESGEPIRNRVELVTSPNGIVNWIITTKVPVQNADGEVIGVAGFSREYERDVSASTMPEELREAIAFIRKNFQDKLKIPDLAKMSNKSVSAFGRAFKQRLHLTPTEFIRCVRVNEACRRLTRSQDTLAKIAGDCGFSDQAHLSREFKLVLCTTPAVYRSKHG